MKRFFVKHTEIATANHPSKPEGESTYYYVGKGSYCYNELSYEIIRDCGWVVRRAAEKYMKQDIAWHNDHNRDGAWINEWEIVEFEI